MSKMKKLLAMFLALAMVLGMSITTFAADANINISFANIGESGVTPTSVTYDKIIEEDRTSTLGWKFVTKYEEAFVKAYLNKETVVASDAYNVIDELIDLKVLEDVKNVNGNASTGTVSNSEALGRALEAIKNTLEKSATVNGTNATFTSTGIGLYAVKADKTGYTFIPMAAYVGTGFNGLNMQAKGASDTVKKSVAGDGQSVAKGDKVTYTVSVEYPYYSKDAETPIFKITDTLSNATFESDYALEVKIDGTRVTTGYVVKIDGTEVTPGYEVKNATELEINFTYGSQYAGKNVVITYVATVGDVSSVNPLENNVKSEIETGATYSKVVSDTVKFTVIKVDKDNNNIKLDGAEFTLYVADANGNEEITVNGVQVKVKAVDVKETGVNEKGTATFDGLDAQKTYYVKETKAPEGYSLNPEAYQLTGATVSGPAISTTETVKENDTIVYTFTANDFDSITVKDTKLIALPSTGGIGTTMFTIAGCGIMIAAAYLFFASRRREEA